MTYYKHHHIQPLRRSRRWTWGYSGHLNCYLINYNMPGSIVFEQTKVLWVFLLKNILSGTYLVFVRRHHDSFHFVFYSILSRVVTDSLYQNLRGCGSWPVKDLESLDHSATAQILTLVCTSWATLSKLLKLPVPQYPHLLNMDNCILFVPQL